MPDRILMEEDFPESLEAALQARGFATKRRGHIGLVNAIGIDAKTGERLGAADPRDDGSAVGY
jgi:gamma-glutamyltranspeptidase